MNRAGLVQGYEHQLLEEFNPSVQISAFQVLALVSIMRLCLWRGEPGGGARSALWARARGLRWF